MLTRRLSFDHSQPSIAGYVEGATYTSASSVVLPDWSLLGCIIEPSDGRALSAASFTSSSMTIAKCVAYCAKCVGLPHLPLVVRPLTFDPGTSSDSDCLSPAQNTAQR